MVMGTSLMAHVSLIVLALAGHAWQIDAHMYFFALLAMLSAYRSIRVLLAAAAFVAVHHIVLNFVASNYVYPGGSSLGRLTIHAAILILETAALSFIVRTIQVHAAESEARRKEAEQARAEIERESEQLKHALSEVEEARRKTLEVDEVARRQKAAADAASEAAEAAAEKEREQVRKRQTVVVEALAEGLGHLASGDLTYQIEAPFDESYEDLRKNFNQTVVTLRSLLTNILSVAHGLDSSVREIAGVAENLSRRTESQSASLSETASAMDQLTLRVRNTAEKAGETDSAVKLARKEAEDSSVVVASAVKAMESIAASAQQIQNITSLIDEIAFQTNLLALNAGVEAARAGEEGRGFAVVATEVRALAQRSAESAREIESLIRTTTSQVENGVSLVAQTGDALGRISQKVSEISDLVSGIYTISKEQVSSISQINIAIGDIDSSTQQNAAMSEETTAATQALSHQAQHLSELVAKFSVEKTGVSVKKPYGHDVNSQIARAQNFVADRKLA